MLNIDKTLTLKSQEDIFDPINDSAGVCENEHNKTQWQSQ